MTPAPSLQLAMLRPTLTELPCISLPAGYRLHSFRPGDGDHWGDIIAASFQNDRQRVSFDAQMRRDPAFRPERVFFISHGGAPVATASAYVFPAVDPCGGSLHYVGVVAGHRGQRLGYWVSLAALKRMEAEGLERVTLRTDDFRLAAIKTYLRLGFAPLVVAEDQRRRWRNVFTNLGDADACQRFATELQAQVWRPPAHPADTFDYAGSHCVRRRWHPNRPVGRPSPLESDALADESLYRAAALGTAGCDLHRVAVAAEQPFTLWFQAGSTALPEGTLVSFHTPGQSPLGTAPQSRDPMQPGFVTAVACPAGVKLEVQGAAFRLQSGTLAPGDRVTLSVGEETGFRWTPLAGPKEFKVIIDVGHGEPRMRLPEPVVVHVVPGSADHVDIFLPATVVVGAEVRATVSVRDRFDNRVPVDGMATLRVGADQRQVPLCAGWGQARVGVMKKGSVRAHLAELTDTAGCGIQLSAPPRRTSGDTVANVCLPAGAHHLYFGDLHVHDFASSAAGYGAEVYRWARDDKRLDFVSLSVQTHAFIDAEKWAIHKHLAETFLDEGRFVTFLAYEWQHAHYGDKVVHFLGGDQPYLPVDDATYDHPAKLYEALRGTDAFLISHHPGYALDQHVPGTDWAAVETDVERLVELWSMHGSSEGYDPQDRPLVGARREEGVMAALRGGLRLGLVAGSDTHSGRPCGSALEPRPYWGGYCGVWAEQLTRRALFAAFMARRTYALTGTRIALEFTVNGAPMGAEIPFSETAEVRIHVWAPSDIATVELLRNTVVAQTFRPTASEPAGECHMETMDRPDSPAFYHCRVTLADGHLAVCSPVWIG